MEFQLKKNCKTGLSRQVGKTSIFTKESLVVIQDKMRERCIEEFNIAYGMDSKLKEKQKGKNRDITPYERKLFNERVKGLKQEISNLENEVSDLEDNKKSINKQISNLNKDKEDIVDEIDKKRKINDKIILKTKNQLLNENQKLSKQNEDLKHENYQLKYKNEELEQQKNYLLYYIKKFLDKMPKVIKDIVEKIFDRNMSVNLYKSQYDPEMLEKQQKRIEANNRKFNLFNKREIEKATKHINNEMEEAAEEFYQTKNDKEKDDGLSL